MTCSLCYSQVKLIDGRCSVWAPFRFLLPQRLKRIGDDVGCGGNTSTDTAAQEMENVPRYKAHGAPDGELVTS